MSPEDKKRVGGSDVASVLGISRYGGPLVPYLRIVDGVEKDDNESMKRGRHLEHAILSQYAQETGFNLWREASVSGLPAHERASLDAVARPEATLWRAVEAKTASWRVMGDWGEPGTDEIPREYLVQVQWYLGALRQDPRALAVDDVADVPALVGGEFGIWQVRFDAEVYEAIREGVKRFWMDHVLPRKPPAPNGATAEGEFIRKRYPQHTANALDWSTLPEEQRHLLVEYRDRRSALAYAEREAEVTAARVKMLLGEHEGVTGLPDGARLDWKQNRPSTVTDWEKVVEHLKTKAGLDAAWIEDIVKQHTTQREGARPLVWREGKKR